MRTDNRLSDSDRETMRSAIVAAVDLWGRDHRVRYGIDTDVLCRIAYHAIGCTAPDMRDAEVAEVRAMAWSFVSDRDLAWEATR